LFLDTEITLPALSAVTFTFDFITWLFEMFKNGYLT
jgi:hypothetical protein